MRCYIPSTQDNHTNIATQILCTSCALQQLCGGATLDSEGSIVSLTLNINFEDDTSLIHDNIPVSACSSSPLHFLVTAVCHTFTLIY